MTVVYHIDPNNNVVYFVGKGEVDGTQVANARRHLLADALHRPGMSILADCRGLDLDVPSERVAQMASSLRRYEDAFGEARIAIVVTNDLQYRLARVYQSFSTEARPTVRVFRELIQARSWLGLVERRRPLAGERRHGVSQGGRRSSGDRRRQPAVS